MVDREQNAANMSYKSPQNRHGGVVLEEGHADLPQRLALRYEPEVFDHAMLQPRATPAGAEQWRQVAGVSR